jgi:hypothetical protein
MMVYSVLSVFNPQCPKLNLGVSYFDLAQWLLSASPNYRDMKPPHKLGSGKEASKLNRAGYSPDRVDALVWGVTELVPPTTGFGDYMLEEAHLGLAELQKKGDVPTQITREWAVGSVEHGLQLIGPPT